MRSQSVSQTTAGLQLEVTTRVTLDLKAISLKQLKAVMRQTSIGLDDTVRRHLWTQIATKHSSDTTIGQREHQSKAHAHREDEHEHEDEDGDGDEDEEQQKRLETKKLPLFVEPRIARFFALNQNGKREITAVLWRLSQSCPHVTFAPLVYPLTALLLHFHDSNETYETMYSLLNSKRLKFLGTTRADKARDAIILIKLTNKFGVMRSKLGAEARHKLKNNAVDMCFAEYLQWIFSLPVHHCVRVMDCFLVEGEKFLFRVALALALLFDKQQRKAGTAATAAQEPVIDSGLTLERMRRFCESIHEHVSPQQLIASALKITRLSHKDISRAKSKAEIRSSSLCYSESPIHTRPDIISVKEYCLGARIAPRRFKSSILTDWNDLDVLWEWIPERVCVREPIVVFCSEENGSSLQHFYTLCSDHEPTLLIIKTISAQIFGAFCSTAWSRRLDLAQTKSGQYFGTGETFLFVLAPQRKKYSWVALHREADAEALQSPVSHSQQLFLSASSRSLCIGSGGGKFGLFLDESLTRGETDRCHTFDNEPLTCSESTHFNVSVVEVIAFC